MCGLSVLFLPLPYRPFLLWVYPSEGKLGIAVGILRVQCRVYRWVWWWGFVGYTLHCLSYIPQVAVKHLVTVWPFHQFLACCL